MHYDHDLLIYALPLMKVLAEIALHFIRYYYPLHK